METTYDPPKPEEAKPFHVMVRGNNWIPISALVFARDSDHAKSRTLDALRLSCQSHDGRRRHAQGVVDKIDSGELAITVEPFDIASMSAEVNWASNGGFA